MKTLYFVFAFLAIFLFSSFKNTEACEYAGSNISYVKTQTGLALEISDLNKAKFYAYRAIKGLYKLSNQLNECGCEQAMIHIEESQENLRRATESISLKQAKLFLKKAYNQTTESLIAIENHHLHENSKIGEEVVINSSENHDGVDLLIPNLKKDDVKVLIDDSLIPYEQSLQKVVDSVDCKDARAFAERIFNICEQELLKPNLTEERKYYNLKTQEITANALKQIGNCGATLSK